MESKMLAILEEAMALNGATRGKVRVVTDGALVIKVQSGFSSQFVDEFGVVLFDSEIVSARAYRSRQRVVVPDVQAHKDDPYHASALREGFRSCQSTPGLDRDGKVLVTLSTHTPQIQRPSNIEAAVLDSCARRLVKFASGLIENRCAKQNPIGGC